MEKLEETVEKKEKNFKSKNKKIYKENDFDEIYKDMKEEILNEFENFIEYSEDGSNWTFVGSTKVVLDVNKIKDLGVSSYFPLPDFLKNKKAIINPKNEDKKYFLWCIGIADLLKTNPNLKNPERISKILKERVLKYNLEGIEFPFIIKNKKASLKKIITFQSIFMVLMKNREYTL